MFGKVYMNANMQIISHNDIEKDKLMKVLLFNGECTTMTQNYGNQHEGKKFGNLEMYVIQYLGSVK